MKTILLIRHAKSSWENFTVSDADRPLNERGKKNAPEMAKRLLKKKIKIEAFISSPALRAHTTAQYFAEVYGEAKSNIILVPELYMAGEEAFTRTIQNAPSKAGTIALFSHNNGITEYANRLTTTRIDDMPTCAVFAVKCKIDNWQDFTVGNNEFYFFDYPKSI